MILLTVSAGSFSFAQVRATGHVFAEIVEASGVNSNTNNSIQISQTSSLNSLELGEITVNGGINTACSVLISSGNLKGDHGSLAAFTASQFENTLPQSLNNNGNQVIKLNGIPGSEILSLTDKNYSGQYQVIFAYN